MKIILVNKNLTNEQIREVCEVLRDGGLVIYPTDTAYGLGVLASSKSGVDKLLEYKGARDGKAVSVAVGARKIAMKYVELNDVAESLYEKYLPGPVTVISSVQKGTIGNEPGQVDSRIISGRKTLGIRIPDSEIVQQITNELDEGITSTSANVSGGETPYSVETLLSDLPEEKKEMVDLIIDAGELPKVQTSTVVDTTVEPMQVLRGKLPEVFESTSEEETYDVAEKVLERLSGKNVGKPVVLLLKGEMGAGKTQFVKGLAKLLGVERTIISPTFILERQYDLANDSYNKLYHYDLWRVHSDDESRVGEFVKNIGLEYALQPGNLIAIEWPENVMGLEDYLVEMDVDLIKINIQIKDDLRIFKV